MLEHQQSTSSTGYLVTESSIYPSAVTANVAATSKTSPSRYQCNELTSQYDQNAIASQYDQNALASQYDQGGLNASQRRHAFSAYKNLRGVSGVSVTGGSTSLESFADSPSGPGGSGNILNDHFSRGRSLGSNVVDYPQTYRDSNHLTVPLGSEFVPVGSRLHFRHHSYDVPPPPPAPDDDGVRRRTLSTIGRGHHSFDSAPHNIYNRRQNDYDDAPPSSTTNWQSRQNMSDRFFDGVPQHFEQSRHSDTRYRSSSYVDAMQSSYDVSSTRTLYQSQFRHSDTSDRQRQRSPHFHRRHTDDGYESYAQQQSQQQQQLYPTSATTYDHYYNNNSSSRLMPNCDDKRQQQKQQGFSDYPASDMFYNGQTEGRIDAERSPLLKANDNHLDSNGGNSGNYYPNPFSNHVTSYVNGVPNFSSVVAVSANSAMTSSVTTSVLPPPSQQQQQHYPGETMNITNNKNYWEWNNNGYPSAAIDYNGGMRNYEYTADSKQFITSNTRYPDVLQKDPQTGFNVVHTDHGHNNGASGGGVNLDICRGGKEDPTTFFRDGIRKIDFVMVYEETHKEAANNFETLQPTTQLNRNPLEDQETKGLKKRQKFNLWRQKFMACLATIGVQIEEDVLEQAKNTIHFIRLHAPWPLLCRYAEELNLRAPIQAHPNPSGNWSEWILSKLRLPNLMYEDVPNKPLDYYTCPFKTSKLDKFLGSDDIESFFTRAQRSRMVYEILATTPFGKEKKGEVGIERLVGEGAYTAAFPLHDGPFEHPGAGTPPSQLNVRQILYHHWARWGKWYKYQPLDHIREYFGEKIAIYFAWLGFYTGWLLPAAVVGVLVFLYGVATMDMNQIALEVCNEGNKYEMCPLCESCSSWKLSDICLYKRVAYLFDHPGTVFYAIFMSFWAVTFLEYWKRKSASLAHHWDCMGFQEEEERPRPDFAAKAPYLEKNPITGVKEPSFPQSIRYKRIAAGTGLILLMISLVLIFIVAVIIYRTLVAIPLFQDETLRPIAQMIASMSGAMLNLVLIMALGRVYEKLAFGLTTWEMHRTQSEFDDNLTFKVFLFQFINFYSSIFYIAFFKGRFVGYPGHYKHIFGNLRNEDCSNGGCLIELAQQLGVIMVGKQMINNAQEIILPKLKAWWHSKKSKLSTIGESRMEMDYRLVENEGLFQEYLEMVLQFGFITIFVAAFPLAPFFALLNNWVEIRLDAQKFVCETRRAVAERAENIGIWFKILDMIAHFAVISNAFLIAFTSEFIAKLVYKYEHDWDMRGYVNFTLAVSPHEGWADQNRSECRYRAFRDESGQFSPTHWKILALKLSFVIIFEHVVFGVCRLIDLVVPDIPESLDVKIKRERYLAKEALQDADHVLQKVLVDPESDRVDSDQDISTGSPMLRKRTLL